MFLFLEKDIAETFVALAPPRGALSSLSLLYAGYLRLLVYSWNKPYSYEIQCCSYSVLITDGEHNASFSVKSTVL